MATDTLSTTLSALADPTRRAILARLAGGSATVKELAAPFAMSGPAVSKHLRVLERAGLITRGREAQWRPCRLTASPLREVTEWADTFRRFWDASYERLDDYLEEMKAKEKAMAAAQTSETTFTTPSDREIVITRTFDAPRHLVFDAWTKPEHVKHWMLGPPGWTMPVCEIDLRPGGKWHFVWQREDGTEYGMHGTYQEIERPVRIVHTESWGGEWAEMLNTLTFTEKDGKTTATLVVLYASKKDRDAALATGMNEGVLVSYERLNAYLQTIA